MILNWMLASAIFALLVAIAAILAERALASSGKPRRLPWLLAIGVSTAWPLVAGAWFFLKPAEQPIAIIRTRIGTTAARAMTEQFRIAPDLSLIVQRLLIGVWVAVSLLLIIRIIVALLRMRSVTREAERVRMDGTEVLLSETAGPAVCGALAPQIVLPRWILELDTPLRAMVLRHEREHVARGDAGVVLGAATAVALVPWSPAVWFMVRRLRLAIELDCDARVLATNDDPNRYGRLLMLVAQRQSHARLQPMLAESSAHLEQRIREMKSSGTKRSRLRAAVLGTIAAGVVVLACSSPVMAGMARPARPKSPLRYANEVLKLPAARTIVPEPPRTVQVKLGAQGPAKAKREEPVKVTQGQGKVIPPPPPKKVEGAYQEFQVEVPVQEAANTQRPRYPDILRSAGVEGLVVVQFIVDSDGSIMDGSTKVLSSTHALFTQAVQTAIPNMRFAPAKVGDKTVRQLVQQEFEFLVDRPGASQEIIQYDTLSRTGGLRVRKLPKVITRVPDLRKP